MLGASFLTNLIVGWDFGRFLVHWIFDVLSWALPVSILALIAGQIVKGDLWYMFIEKPDGAARQELAAMAMAAHQSLRNAVRKAGYDEAVLRPKESFKAD
jgi:23S rRNA C2498 (ribose-2'-O)-methylase RlmM